MRCTRSTWRAFSRTCGPSTARRWWPRAARPCSVRCCPATGDPTNRCPYRSRWSCWTKFPTARSSSCRPATTRIRRPTCETTEPCRPPASPSSTTSDSSAAVEEVRLKQFNNYHHNRGWIVLTMVFGFEVLWPLSLSLKTRIRVKTAGWSVTQPHRP